MDLDERRRLRADLLDLGLAGLALLRLHALRDPTDAEELLAVIRRQLDNVGRDSGSLEVRNPVLDVIAGYERWAEVYDSPGNPLIASEELAVREILDGIEVDPVVDSACGTGRHLAYLAQHGRNVIGTDISAEMLEKARLAVPDADLRVGDLRQLPLRDGEAAALVCALALEHVDDLSPVYGEFARVVAPGGAVVVSTMHPVLRSVFGWGAWFVDAGGRVDIPTYPHEIGDHVNAAAGVGLALRRCVEPTAAASYLENTERSLATRIAYSGLPMVLVLKFERP